MSELFSQILNMSLTGSIVIGAVLLFRACIRKLPKIFSYALWSVVLFRLLCPVSISGPGSLLELLKPQVQETTDTVSVVSYLPVPDDLPEFQYVAVDFPEVQPNSIEKELSVTDVFGLLWIAGVSVMILYGAAQYLQLCRRLVGAICYRGNIYLADHIDTAFVMGILFPKIYIPSHVPKQERRFILAHERHHIRRGDHFIKLLAYLALCIHWFNPLIWIAFILAGKDMEMSCDEAVIRRFGSQIRAEYSASLLRLAAHRKPVPGMPLAFGEGDTKGRIMNMAKWKKPKIWASILCGILCIAVLAACAVNPRKDALETTVPEASNASDSAYLETITRENADPVNILLVVLPDGEDAAKLGNSTLLLSLDNKNNDLTIQSIPGETDVNLPDYKGHHTGNHPFQTCYALGYAWEGRSGAMEMTNLCLEEQFEVNVDYNVEITRSGVMKLIDALGGVTVEDAFLDGEAAAVYGRQQENENSPTAAEHSRLRQRKLLASVLTAIQNSSQIEETILPDLYAADDLDGQSVGWSVLMDMLQNGAKIYLGSMEAETKEPSAPVASSDIVTNVELVQYGTLKLLLPEDISSYAKDNAVLLTRDGKDVGGIKCYNAPDMPFDISIDYLAAIGLPEAQMAMKGEEPIAYMLNSDAGIGIEAEFFHELRPETLNVEHHVYTDGELVYDVYFDQNLLSDVQADKFLKTIELNEEPIYYVQSQKDESFILCRNTLHAIQSGAYQISVERENQGGDALNNSSATVYTASGDNWVSITHVPDDDSYHGSMEVSGTYYSNEGNGWGEDGSINWYADPYEDEVYTPWLASFQWNEELVTYEYSIVEEGKKTVSLRIDEPFRGYEDLTECYFLNMHFTEDGSFLNAKIDIVYAQGADVTYIEIFEAIKTLDEETINDYITNEYNRAVSAS